MTPDQKTQFNLMRATLDKIASGYQTPDELRETSEEQFGLEFPEALEMAYENIQADARCAVAGIAQIK